MPVVHQANHCGKSNAGRHGSRHGRKADLPGPPYVRTPFRQKAHAYQIFNKLHLRFREDFQFVVVKISGVPCDEGLARTIAAENSQRSLEKNVEIEPRGPVLYVKQILFPLPRKVSVAAACHLPQAGQSRGNALALSTEILIEFLRMIGGGVGARQCSYPHAKRSTVVGAHRCYCAEGTSLCRLAPAGHPSVCNSAPTPRVQSGWRPDTLEALLGIHTHSANLKNLDRSPARPNSPLQEKSRAGINNLYSYHHGSNEREDQQQCRPPDSDISSALEPPVAS